MGLSSRLTLNHFFSTWAWNWPFCPQSGLAGASFGPPHIMSSHQNPVCLLGPPAQPQEWVYLRSGC